MKKTHISVSHVKDPCLADEDVVKDYELYEEYPDSSLEYQHSLSHGKRVIAEVGTVYVRQTSESAPKWQKDFFHGLIDVKAMTTGVALIVRLVVDDSPETFVVTMGAQGRFIVDSDVLEDRFGIKAALCIIDSKKLRQIQKNEISGSNRITYQQVSRSSSIGEFDLDTFSDFLKSVTGSSKDPEHFSGMIKGSSSLSFSAKVDITNIIEQLTEITRLYRSDAYKEEFEWIDNLYPINDKKTIKKLDDLAIEHANLHDGTVWFAIPEIVDMEKISGFRYCGIEAPDITLEEIINSRGAITSEVLNSQVNALENLTGQPYKRWGLRRCLCGEVKLEDKVYGINNGSWFCIDKSYADKAEKTYLGTELYNCPISAFDTSKDYKWQKNGEDEKQIVSESAYLERVSSESDLVLMDQNLVKGIEVCDLVTKDALIHVKRYSNSSVLSHFFFQGLNSALMLDTDDDFLEGANAKIAEKTADEDYLIGGDQKRSIVFAIITKEPEQRPHLPLFSKISLRTAVVRLQSFGYSCKLMAIPMLETEK